MILRSDMRPTTPCLDCGTRFGRPRNPGSLNPDRTRSLCKSCYEFHHARGTLRRFTRIVKARPAVQELPGKLRNPGERREERRRCIAARVARHEAVGGALPAPIVEADYDHRTVGENALQTSAAWLATHAQTAEWDDPSLSESLAANAERPAA